MTAHLYVIAGCSGVGKGTVIQEFLKKNQNISLSVSYTTRKPRPGEIDGKSYKFVSKDTFNDMIKNDEFLEFAEFNGNFYGTSKEYVLSQLNQGNNVLLEIDIKGSRQVKEKFQNAICIFILPPSEDELELRLRKRNTESDDVIAQRMCIAKQELSQKKFFDYCIVNDNIDRAVSELQHIFNIRG